MFREKWIIIISLAVGLAAAGFFYFYSGGHILRGRKQANESAPVASLQTKQCVIVVKDVPLRTPLTKDMLAAVRVPVELAHPLAVTSVKSAVGRVTRDRLIKGQFLLAPNLRDANTPSELSFVLPKNMRAITVGATVTNAVANMLRPGDFVDIIVYLNSQVAGENVSFTMLRKVLVLATDSRLEDEKESNTLNKMTGSVEDARGYQSVTLAASPPDCVKLNLAESVGQIKLALHAPQETKVADAGKEIALTGDLAKEFGFKVVKNNSAAPASASAPAAVAQNSENNGRSGDARAQKPSAAASEPARVVYIMRGSKIETMTAVGGAPRKLASEKGDSHEN